MVDLSSDVSGIIFEIENFDVVVVAYIGINFGWEGSNHNTFNLISF